MDYFIHKVGSLQKYVKGYDDACVWLRKNDSNPLDDETFTKNNGLLLNLLSFC